MTTTRPSVAQALAAVAVLIALAGLTAFAIWGMRPSTTTTSVAPAQTAPAQPVAPSERENEGRDG